MSHKNTKNQPFKAHFAVISGKSKISAYRQLFGKKAFFLLKKRKKMDKNDIFKASLS